MAELREDLPRRDVHPPAPKVKKQVVLSMSLCWRCQACGTRVPEGYSCHCGRRQLNEG